jgi:hypothetical protein
VPTDPTPPAAPRPCETCNGRGYIVIGRLSSANGGDRTGSCPDCSPVSPDYCGKCGTYLAGGMIERGSDPSVCVECAEAAPPRATTPPKWGDALRYLTDDRDYPTSEQRELLIFQGGNGDYYVQSVEPGHRILRGVRICMSGGCSSENPALARAIADAYRALYDAAHGRESPTPPMRAPLAAHPATTPEPITAEQVAQWKVMSWGHYNAPVARMLDEITRLSTLEQDAARIREAATHVLADYDCWRVTSPSSDALRAALREPTATPENAPPC